MKIPLVLRLKKSSHREIAKAQDIVVESLYEAFDDAVLHGGTAIWRCYGGSRFSEDVDVYITRNLGKISAFFETLKRKGFAVEKKKIGERSIFSTLRLGRTVVQFEAVFRKVKGSLKEYETAEGNLLTVYALAPEDIIKEKVSAYLNRFKVRDLYDIFFLLRYVHDIWPVKKGLEILLRGYRKPADEKELKILILEGPSPGAEGMLEYVKGRIAWEKKGTRKR